jgi:hypothetical protein
MEKWLFNGIIIVDKNYLPKNPIEITLDINYSVKFI